MTLTVPHILLRPLLQKSLNTDLVVGDKILKVLKTASTVISCSERVNMILHQYMQPSERWILRFPKVDQKRGRITCSKKSFLLFQSNESSIKKGLEHSFSRENWLLFFEIVNEKSSSSIWQKV